MTRLRDVLADSSRFATLAEIVATRGRQVDDPGQKVAALTEELADDPRFDALSITDNAGGNATIGPESIGAPLLARGQDVIIHQACKDWNRNGLQSRMWQLADTGFDNVLALSGDYPVTGYAGQAQPVFDIDSVALLQMIDDMNAGRLKENIHRKKSGPLPDTDLFAGAVVNNYKRHENEVMPQYFKLAKKIRCGARFIINQIGFDARKMDELIHYSVAHQLDVPFIANVFVLTAPTARFFNGGNIPGVYVNDELNELAQQHGKDADKGKAFFLELAAKQCAIARGVGFRGVYLGGHVSAADFGRVLDITASYGESAWRIFAAELQYAHPSEFYYFEPGDSPGTSSDEVSGSYRASKTKRALRRSRRRLVRNYRFSRWTHEVVFTPETLGFRIGRALVKRAERSPRRKRRFHRIEQLAKVPVFECRDCGDCSLPDVAYLCPESQCAKNQRNGPCGGTRQGTCEVGEKSCIWARAYDRLKAYGEEEQMLEGPVVIKDGALQGTSAWTNTFLERDHHARTTSPGGKSDE